MKKQVFNLFAAALVMLLTLPASADAPKKAIGKDTMLTLWVDVEQISPELIKTAGTALAGLSNNPILNQQGGALPLGEMATAVEKMTSFRNGFVKAGGTGVLMTMEMPGEESWSPPISMLAKSKDKLDTKAMTDLIKSLGEDAKEAEQVDVQFMPLEGGWHDISIVSAEGDQVTLPLPKPDEAAFKAFDKQMKLVKKPMMSLAFRMQDSLREKIQVPAGQQQDPQAAMMMGMLRPLQKLDTVGVSVSMANEKDYVVDIHMAFLDANSANQFLNTYNAQMMFAPALLAGMLDGAPNAPSPKDLNAFFMKLQMKGNGDTLSLKLDQAFFDMAEKLGPLLAPQDGGGDVPF